MPQHCAMNDNGYLSDDDSIGCPSELGAVLSGNEPICGPPINSLHLTPYDPDTYFNITPSQFGRYEVIDDLLYAKPMADQHHNNIIDFVRFRIKLKKDKELRWVRTKHGGKIPDHMKYLNAVSCINPTMMIGGSVYIPDYALGFPRNPTSEGATFDDSGQILVIVEVTSTNRNNDLIRKKKAYAEIGIPVYIIVERDVRNKGGDHNPYVLVCTLVDGVYQETIYLAGARSKFFFPGIGMMEVDELLNPGDVSKMETDEEKKRDSKIKKLKKLKKYKEVARQSGYPVSDSSYSSSSSSSSCSHSAGLSSFLN